MTDLKTLKDLFINKDGTEWESSLRYQIPMRDIKEELKQEAIKWVKDIRKRADDRENQLNRDRLLTVQGWILKFFNLTEEDLK